MNLIERVHTILIKYNLLVGDKAKQKIALPPIVDTNTMNNAENYF